MQPNSLMSVAVTGTVNSNTGCLLLIFSVLKTLPAMERIFYQVQALLLQPMLFGKRCASAKREIDTGTMKDRKKNQCHVIISSSSPIASILHCIKSKIMESNIGTLVPAEYCTFEVILSSVSSVIISFIVCSSKENVRFALLFSIF